jgi:hypothetical protein
MLYAGSLAESGHAGDAAPLLKGNPLPPSTLGASFESLYFPKYLDWRGDHAGYVKLAGSTAAPAQ